MTAPGSTTAVAWLVILTVLAVDAVFAGYIAVLRVAHGKFPIPGVFDA